MDGPLPSSVLLALTAADPLTIAALAVILVLLILSACMSASEVALFSLSPTQLRDLKERGAPAERACWTCWPSPAACSPPSWC